MARPHARTGGALRTGLFAALAAVFAQNALAQHEWTQFAGSAARVSVSATLPAPLTVPAWTRSTDAAGRAITFVGQAGVVCSRDFAIAVGSVVISGSPQFRLFAVDRRTAALRWAAPIPTPSLSSWSTPAIDTLNNTVIAATGRFITAVDLFTGQPRWQTELDREVVNASPLVTSDLPLTNRVFITDFDGFGISGRLYCINADPRRIPVNPYNPGEIVWSTPIGATSGNTPAYARNTFGQPTVFVTSVGEFSFAPGLILAFPADTTSAPFPSWVFENPKPEGFFGGLCVAGSGSEQFIYAASYAYFAGINSGNLVKVRADDGQLVWSVDCNRTSSTPIPVADNRIAVSTGISGFGSRRSIQLYRDLGSSAVRVWDSGDVTPLGGWTHQPAAAPGLGGAGRTLFVGTIPASSDVAAPCTDLYQIDLDKPPGTSGFIMQHIIGGGSTPALADANLYTVGAAGLIAFGPPPPDFDVNGDHRVDVDDLYAWGQGRGNRDVNQDGAVTLADQSALEAELRRGEIEDMKGGRP
ncbi:MAG: PQQ-binding-like beta-propeller repeat protein [Phycisphaerales bacterium]|nr:PQQ-binding-like beta-propeller repeat protein [Phycisphaerales bacterium]